MAVFAKLALTANRNRTRAARWLMAVVLTSIAASGAGGAEPSLRQGTIRFEPAANEGALPEHFRLDRHSFDFQEKPRGDVSDELAISLVTFPSPLVTPHAANNTVHCEYYRPLRSGRPRQEKAPAVVVLHILGGDFELARLFSNVLAHRGVAALFLKMPYYGPRRAAGVERRMISLDTHETVEGMTQAVLDVRRAVAWLAARKEVDSDRLGVFGISLGAITAALAATAEPRLKNVCLLLAGGDMGSIFWESPKLAAARRHWLEGGGSREEYLRLVAKIDPVAYGANVRDRRILMLNAKHDEIIPRHCTESLWQAFGRPEIVWYEGGHYTVSRHTFNIVARVSRFFAPREE